MEGKTLQLDLEGLAITLFLDFAYGTVEANLDFDGEPDARVSGSPEGARVTATLRWFALKFIRCR